MAVCRVAFFDKVNDEVDFFPPSENRKQFGACGAVGQGYREAPNYSQLAPVGERTQEVYHVENEKDENYKGCVDIVGTFSV